MSTKFLREYREHIIKSCPTLPLADIAPGAVRPGAKPLELADVYVDLDTDMTLPKRRSLAEHLEPPAREPEREGFEQARDPEGTRRVPVLEALACHRVLALLGAPGAGKSTLVQYLCLQLAGAGRANRPSKSQLAKWWTFGPLLPVRVILRDFAATLAADGTARALDLWNFIGDELRSAGLHRNAGRLLQAEAQAHGALFLLDGLDETRELAVRARVAEAVAEFVRGAGDRCRFLITTRPYAWAEMNESRREEEGPLREHHHAFGSFLQALDGVYHVADFSREQSAEFVGKWYDALLRQRWIPTEKETRAKAEDLRAALPGDHLSMFACNPLLLTLMASLHSWRTRLPGDRTELYDEVVKLMLDRWNTALGRQRGLLDVVEVPGLRIDQVRTVLERVAYAAHERSPQPGATADIVEGDLRAALEPLLLGSADKAARAIEFIEVRAGLLLGRGSRGQQRQFSFPHRTFQEFLAACHLSTRPDFEKRAVVLAAESPGHWREALRLAARRAGDSRGVPACDGLVHRQDAAAWLAENAPAERDWRRAMLAAEMLVEIGLTSIVADPDHRVVCDRIAGWLVALLERGALPAKERAAAGDLLAELGDPRPGVVPRDLAALAQMEFCLVPRGDFLMGDEPAKRTALDYEYWIGRHPVTVAQFRLFVDAGGYGREEFWPEAQAAKVWRKGRFKPEFDNDWVEGPGRLQGGFASVNRPIVGVSWFEAQAFCRWLTEAWRDQLPQGWRITLPGDAEWEKAARGGERMPPAPVVTEAAAGLAAPVGLSLVENPEPAREYPWRGAFDSNRANCEETKIGETSAAGCFTAGEGPCGAQDMAGNVWEWLRSEHEGAKGARVLRGGAFAHGTTSVRCAFRLRCLPGFRFHDVGFRVAASPFSDL